MKPSAGRETAIVTGAAGQDGRLLVARLLDDGLVVHAVVRPGSAMRPLIAPNAGAEFHIHEVDAADPLGLVTLIGSVQPRELYNLVGLSSVSRSFEVPAEAWQTNASLVAALLEAVRISSPETHVYQASSSEMFGWIPGGAVRHAEDAPLLPQSPYAAAKAAAHALCGVYRAAYGLRVACGILFNHESRRRPRTFLTRKVTDHVRALRASSHPYGREPLHAGNLMARRDWGFAPDYVDGMRLILRQVSVRAVAMGNPPEPDEGHYYRDYVLGTGRSHAVWELIDRAFDLGGFPLDWELESEDPAGRLARFHGRDAIAVRVDPLLLRPNDPMVIEADASRAREELGWAPHEGLDPFLRDMLAIEERP